MKIRERKGKQKQKQRVPKPTCHLLPPFPYLTTLHHSMQFTLYGSFLLPGLRGALKGVVDNTEGSLWVLYVHTYIHTPLESPPLHIFIISSSIFGSWLLTVAMV
ncbi:uncharacterized protein BDW43DRAFT_269948 [Aspergillus alliaceus]|uniref:uncharacterized protein n=1 Tax=Petromyces alliaceus TaxID=209559 RepID=UPI0012A627C2|nr:uncharacterized protein BDW43DRAFT_269948 [Aspergillus alliaceus]KAB8235372.1 hypothetical protein BDW43DRAFT_269948 [Aspergillus alliaceus]